MHKYGSFDVKPKIVVDYYNKEKPYKLLNNVAYLSNYKQGEIPYRIVINKGYSWNGANISKCFWRIIGSQFNPEFLPASMVHDWLCENKYFILKGGVRVSSDIFRDILVDTGVNRFKANVMATAVYLFQLTQGGWK